jgi:DNA processing protein
MEAFPDPGEAWAASGDQLASIGLKPQTIAAIDKQRPAVDVFSVWRQLVDDDVQAVTIQDDDYPPLLREIHAPPPLLTYRGTLPTGTCVAVVGTRRCTKYGLDVAKQLGRELAQAGITVVSGLALGIDAAAHAGALEGNGQTVAVIGTGLASDVMYPAEHNNLAREILDKGGCIISEHSLRMPGLPGHFPRRNRIVSGLCRAVVVVEAGEKSGALLTAHLATEQNREVLAVPGAITSPASFGTNRLLKKGAAVCRCAADVLEALGLEAEKAAAQPIAKPTQDVSDLARKFHELLPNHGAVALDQLGEELGIGAANLATIITELELAGAIERDGSSLRKV